MPYLATPAYDVFAVEEFVRQHLYRAKPEAWKDLLATTLAAHGEPWRVGILRQLFDDLGNWEATEEKRISSPFEYGELPRRVLIQAFAFPKEVRSSDLPFSDVEEASDRARLIADLIHDTDPAITAAVARVLRETDDDYLALACFRRCLAAGSIDAILAACDRRIPRATTWKPELMATKAIIEKHRAEEKALTLADLPPWR